MFLKHSAIYSASILVNGLIGFAAVALNTRLLGADEYGHYALAFSTAMFASTFLFEWLRLSLMRFSETADGPKLISNSLMLYSAGSAIILCVAAILYFMKWDSHFPVNGWIGVGLFAVCVGVAELFLGLARSSLRPSLFASMQITRGVLALALGGCAAWLGYGFVGLIIGMAAANLITVVVGFLRHPEWQTYRPVMPTRENIMTLLRFGLPIVITVLAMQVMLVLDRYFISAFHGASAVGAYAAAGDISQKLIVMLATGVNLAAYNLTVHVFERDGQAAAEDKLRQTLSILLAMTLPVAVGIALVAKPLGHLLLGVNVAAQAIELLPLYAAVSIIQVIRSYYIEQPYYILKTTRGLLIPYGVASVVALAAWFILIPEHGAKGAIYGLILGHLAASVFSFRGAFKQFKFLIPWLDITIIIAGVGVMACVVSLLPWPEGVWGLFYRVSLGGIAYIIVAVTFNLLNVRHVILTKLKMI